MKKYILFDNDGVLVETEKWYHKANIKALAEIDIELSFDAYMETMISGRSVWEVANTKGLSKEIIDRQRAQRDLYYQEFLRSEHIEIDGVVDILQELSKNYKMGIVTTSRRADFDLIHNQRDIVKFMDFTLCVEEYPRAKPYPDPYLAGMKKFNALEKECLVIEDSQRGLSSAFNANIECAIVENNFTASHDFTNASYHIRTLQDLPELLAKIK